MKILVAYAYSGAGHKRAAEAVADALTDYNKKIDVTLIDILDYTGNFLKFLYPRIYLFLIDRTPLLWGFLYYLLDIRLVDRVSVFLRRGFHNFYAGRFERLISDENPDVVVCTHFFPSEVAARLKKKNIFKGRLITIITDMMPHYFWLEKGPDYFIVAIEETKKDLVKRGIDENMVKVLGIPCDPAFGFSKGRAELIKKMGLGEDFFNVLIMGGGFGTGPVEKIIDSVCTLEVSIRDSLQVIVICGKNKVLFEQLNKKRSAFGVKLYIFGYMTNIDEFMELSDCIVTKSGGLTISEALSKKLPMIIIQPIPGQETRNAKVLARYGAALCANKPEKVRDYVRDFIKFPEKIIGMKARINFLAYPDAAKDIAEFVAGGKLL